MIAKRSRGRPRGSRVDPVVRMMRQTGNPDFMAANMARGIIAYYQPRQEKEKRLRAELDACKARGGDIWPIIDQLGMLDIVDDPAVGLHREKKNASRTNRPPGWRLSSWAMASQAGGHNRNPCRRAPNGLQQASTRGTMPAAESG